ncbi:MAG: ABC transporter ATP-binding protein [Legionellaceae bacterium]|nr:ABC transporter ATP-binding protein [Legionellaceae bacterium]
MIALTDVSKTYQIGPIATTVLKQVSLNVHAGDMLAIVGTSGSGKSTLMNIIGLLDKADTGQYHFRNSDVAKCHDDALAKLRNQSFGFVFQQFNLLPRFSALQNVALPLMYRNASLTEALTTAENTLARVGMSAFATHRPTQLSGGQQQRIAIARALVGEPDVILADEPTGSLDSATGKDIMQLFSILNDEGRTVIIVTHDEQVAACCTKRITLIDGEIM